MSSFRMLNKGIRFENPWKDKKTDMLRDIRKHLSDMPSASQWHRFHQHVLMAETVQEIKQFLESRKDRKKVRMVWTFRFRGWNFNEFMIKNFVRKIETAKEVRDLHGKAYFGLVVSLPPKYVLEHKEDVKLAILKKILLEFIERVLLTKENLNFSVSKDKKVEVS